MSTTKIEGKFRVGDLVWTAEECWLHVLSNLPHDVPTPVQRDHFARKGLPLIFMKYLPKDQWSDWMIESESMSKDGNSRMWCLVFFDGREWVVDQFDISGKDPGV